MIISEFQNGHDEFPETGEWAAFRSRVVDAQKAAERTLRRELVHDRRAGRVRLQNVNVRDIADEALCRVLDDWRSKPTGTAPYHWMLKYAMHLLDEALDREALAAEGRAEERAEERKLIAHDVVQDDEERMRWFDVAKMARGEPRSADDDASDSTSAYRDAVDETESLASPEDADHQFDGLTSTREVDPEVSADLAESLAALEHAMLRLPEIPRRALALRYLDGLDVEDVAYLLGLTESRVEDEVANGLGALRRDLRTAR